MRNKKVVNKETYPKESYSEEIESQFDYWIGQLIIQEDLWDFFRMFIKERKTKKSKENYKIRENNTIDSEEKFLEVVRKIFEEEVINQKERSDKFDQFKDTFFKVKHHKNRKEKSNKPNESKNNPLKIKDLEKPLIKKRKMGIWTVESVDWIVNSRKIPEEISAEEMILRENQKNIKKIEEIVGLTRYENICKELQEIRKIKEKLAKEEELQEELNKIEELTQEEWWENDNYCWKINNYCN